MEMSRRAELPRLNKNKTPVSGNARRPQHELSKESFFYFIKKPPTECRRQVDI